MSTKLNGTVTVHGSKPATTAVVELHNDNGDVVDQVQVDDGGRYTYHLSAGTWGLRVWDAHGHRAGRQVEVGNEGEKVLDIDLEEPEGGH